MSQPHVPGTCTLAGDFTAESLRASHQDVCCSAHICGCGDGGRLSAAMLSSLLQVAVLGVGCGGRGVGWCPLPSGACNMSAT